MPLLRPHPGRPTLPNRSAGLPNQQSGYLLPSWRVSRSNDVDDHPSAEANRKRTYMPCVCVYVSVYVPRLYVSHTPTRAVGSDQHQDDKGWRRRGGGLLVFRARMGPVSKKGRKERA